MSDEAFARPVTLKGDGRTVSYGLDDGLLVEFYIKPKLMQHLTEEQAQPVYQDRIYTRIIAPGNNKTAWDYETKGLDYKLDDDGQVCGYEVLQGISQEHSCPNRFPKAWERFEKKDQKLKEGWDLSEWGAITRSFAENLKAYNVHTVEALASLSDANADNIMGGRKYRDLAKAALDEASILSLATLEQERANKAEERVKEQDAKIAALTAQVAALQMGVETVKARKSA
jgi:hypothetical protein